MSVTIDSLDIQIRSSAGSAAKNIDDLAKALGNLNANAKVTKIVHSLERLNGALASMKSQTSTMSHLSALSKSLASLAAIPKLTGLQSAIRELKKLPEIMKSLDTAEISQFTAKIKLLAKGLAPLATQIDKIGKGFSKLPAQVSKCVTAVKRLDSANRSAAKSAEDHGEALNAQSFNFLAAYENLSNIFSMIHGVQDAFARLMDDAIQWDGIQFRFGRAFGEDADMVLEYAQKVSDELKINMQQFMQYSSLYGSLLSGFGMAQEQVTTISIGLTELSYDIWAAYNDRYRTLEDASEAVRSAITGEIEPIRNAGIALTEASMQEYLDSIGMAHVSLEKLTEAQKSEVRYAAMVKSAMQQGIVGTYAREMNTAEGAVRTLTQQLKTLGQALGSLFLPILQAVLPWISAFVDLITDAIKAIAAFFGIKFQEIKWGDPTGMKQTADGMGQTADGANSTADALGDAAKNAKAMRDYTMGFDELNVIEPPSDSSGGAGAGAGAGDVGGGSLGLDLDTLWDEAVFASASKQIDELKQKIKDFYEEWRWQIEAIGAGTMLMTLGKMVEKLKEAGIFSGGFLKNMNTISKVGLSAVVITLQWTLMDQFLENFIQEGSWAEFIKAAVTAALGTWALGAMWGPTGVIIGLGITAAVSLGATFEDGSVDSIEEVVTGLTGLAAVAGAVGVILKKTDLGAAISLLFSGAKFGDVFAAWFPQAASITSTVTTWVTTTLLPGFRTALTKLPTMLVNVVKAIPGWGWIVTAITGAIALAVADYDFTDIGYRIGYGIGSALKNVGKFFGAAGDWIAGVGKSIMDGIDAAWEWVKEEFDFNSVVELIVLMFNPVSWVTKIVPKMIEIGSEVLPGLWQGIEDGWNNFWSNIEEFLDGFIQGFMDGLGISSPSKVFAEIGTFIVEGLLNGITEKWEDLKKWYSTNVAPKFTKEYWLTKWDTIRQGAVNKLKEAKEGIAGKWGEVKSWFSTNVAPLLTIEYWKTKFDGVRQGITDKLTEVKNSISDKWTEVKKWYSTNVAPKFTKVYWAEKFAGLKDGFVQTIKNMLNSGIEMLNRFISWLNDKMSFSWDAITVAGKEIVPAGHIQLFTIPQISGRFADGGFPDMGQMFIAREAGPELVGNINGRTAVANNDQIVAAVSQGVYSAVVAAMSSVSNDAGQAVNVYLDGKQIAAAVEKRQSERGRTLMGNQLGYAY